MVFKNWRWFDNSGSSKNLRIFYGLENWSPFVLWRINISHCEKHLFSISKNFFDSLESFQQVHGHENSFGKKIHFGSKMSRLSGIFPIDELSHLRREKFFNMMMRVLKNPFRLLRINVESGVCHSFREIARISLSKFFEKRHNFSQPFFLILTP